MIKYCYARYVIRFLLLAVIFFAGCIKTPYSEPQYDGRGLLKIEYGWDYLTLGSIVPSSVEVLVYPYGGGPPQIVSQDALGYEGFFEPGLYDILIYNNDLKYMRLFDAERFDAAKVCIPPNKDGSIPKAEPLYASSLQKVYISTEETSEVKMQLVSQIKSVKVQMSVAGDAKVSDCIVSIRGVSSYINLATGVVSSAGEVGESTPMTITDNNKIEGSITVLGATYRQDAGGVVPIPPEENPAEVKLDIAITDHKGEVFLGQVDISKPIGDAIDGNVDIKIDVNLDTSLSLAAAVVKEWVVGGKVTVPIY